MLRNTQQVPTYPGSCLVSFLRDLRKAPPSQQAGNPTENEFRWWSANIAMFRWLDALNARATTQRDVGWSWVVCLVCIFFNVFVNGFSLTIGLLYTHLLNEFGQSRAKTGMLSVIIYNSLSCLFCVACRI